MILNIVSVIRLIQSLLNLIREKVTYCIHGNTVSEEEVAKVGGVGAEAIRLQRRESLQDVKGRVLKALGDEAQTQVHGIYKRNNKY